MFGATDELLMLGIGAARDGDRQQARFYLEWTLNDDPTTVQVAEAWYWLSRIADDRERQRHCLELALATNPYHPEARRDLALLDGRLRADELVDNRQGVAPHIPDQAVDAGEVRRYPCPKCGGALHFDAARGALRCQFCGHTATAAAQNDSNDTIEEQDWAVAAFSRRGHRWVLPTARVIACQECGASEWLPEGMSTGRCAFCGSTRVLLAQAQPELIAPEGVAPFAFDAAAARTRARQWLSNQPLCPSDLAERAELVAPRPVYLPFWTFDIEGEIAWRGFVEVNDRRILRTGTAHQFHDDVHVPAGRSLAPELLREFRCAATVLEPYSPDLLAGWPVELYHLPPTDASLLAREQVLNASRAVFATDDDGATVFDLTVNSTNLHVASYKLVLLPAWIIDYRYGDERHRLVLNGQNGDGHGEVPRGRVRGWLARALDWA